MISGEMEVIKEPPTRRAYVLYFDIKYFNIKCLAMPAKYTSLLWCRE
jgi:hypothetical protein